MTGYPWSAVNADILKDCFKAKAAYGSSVDVELLTDEDHLVDDHVYKGEFKRRSYADFLVKLYNVALDDEVVEWTFTNKPFDGRYLMDFNTIINADQENDLSDLSPSTSLSRVALTLVLILSTRFRFASLFRLINEIITTQYGYHKIFFLLPSKGKFLQNFANNDQLKVSGGAGMATARWAFTNSAYINCCPGIGPRFITIPGIMKCLAVITRFNTGAYGRLSPLFSSLIGTAVIEYVGIKTNIKTGLTSLYWLCAINNALYCLILYFLTSVVWCNFNFCRTNAYKFLKF